MALPARLFVLDLGRIESDPSWVLPTSSPATLQEPAQSTAWAPVPTLAFLIDHPSAGWILFDTGCHPSAMHGHWPRGIVRTSPWYPNPENQLPAQLGRIGLIPSDIKVVALSHLHMDHAGGLCHFQDTPAAKGVLVHRTELSWALLKTQKSDRPYGYGYVRGDFSNVAISFRAVTGDHLVAEGVRLLCLPGHTPGLYGLRVDLYDGGTVLLPSDAAYESRSYGPPVRAPASVYDSLAFHRSVERLRDLQRQTDAQMLFSHDWRQYKDELRLAPESYP